MPGVPALVYDEWGNPVGSPTSNPTGANLDPAAVLWKGAQRPNQWTPPEFLQRYGNYTGLFPSLGQQVGQALHGGVQAQNRQPSWMQSMLPPRQNNNQSMAKYYPALQPPPPGSRGVQGAPWMAPNPNYGAGQPTGSRTMGNPYPLNGRVPLTQSLRGSPVNHGTNPFIGLYQGLSGFPDNGTPQQGTPPGGLKINPEVPPPGPSGPPPGPPTMPSLPPSAPGRTPGLGLLGQQMSSNAPMEQSPGGNNYGYGTPGGYQFETGKSTLDPGSMAGLLAFLGGSQNVPIKQQQQNYLNYYRNEYPQGVPYGQPGGSNNYLTADTNYLTGKR